MKTRYHLLFSAAFANPFFSGCTDEKSIVSLPVVQTVEITNISSTTASSGGIIVDDGGGTITEKGICWNVEPRPTKELTTKTIETKATVVFASHLSNLVADRQYFVRAYATNSAGTSYGNEISFTTEKSNSIVYKADGRSVKLGDPSPIPLDLKEDGQVDFTLFLELTANNLGDHLYAGINPIGINLVKSGPAINTNFLNMGFAIAETSGSTIDASLENGQRWTSDHSALVIRHTSTGGTISYEGSWQDSPQIVAIQYKENNLTYLGWLRIELNKTTEIVTLVDYAYNSTSNEPVIAGADSN